MSLRTSLVARLVACMLLTLNLWLVLRPAPSSAQFYPPIPGERIRIQLAYQAAFLLNLPARWEGTYLMIQEENLVGRDPARGGMVVPLNAVETLDVQRAKGGLDAVRRGAIAAAVFGTGAWLFLSMLCRGRTCHDKGFFHRPLGLSVSTALGFGLLVGGQGPGNHWVRVAVPAPRPRSSDGPVTLTGPWRVPRGSH